MSEYERLTAFTALLQSVAELLHLKGRDLAADVLHDEAVHFAGERDIARTVAELDDEFAFPGRDLGLLDDDDCPTGAID